MFQGDTFINTGTGTPFNSSGASLIVVGISFNDGVAAPVLSDSLANTWVPLTPTTVALGLAQIYYVANPITGDTHTITLTGTSIIAAATVACYQGASFGTPFDGENTFQASGAGFTTLQPGSVTPTQSGDLIVSVIAHRSTNAVAIDSGLTILDQFVYLSDGFNYGHAFATIIQGAAAAMNPTWSWSPSITSPSAVIAAFRANTSIALTGTITSATETDIVTGAKTIVLTATGDTFVPA